jgi:hypothetical protein
LECNLKEDRGLEMRRKAHALAEKVRFELTIPPVSFARARWCAELCAAAIAASGDQKLT